MTRDILTFMVSTVGSKSTFNIGCRVLVYYRSQLQLNTIEAVICLLDWFNAQYREKNHCIDPLHSKVEDTEISDV